MVIQTIDQYIAKPMRLEGPDEKFMDSGCRKLSSTMLLYTNWWAVGICFPSEENL